jgi:hypothetical protein
MKNKTSQTLYSYWNEMRKGRLAPRRFDIEPARIAGILSETMILEYVDQNELRFRLAGTRVTEHFGAELRGRNFLELWNEEDRSTLQRKLMALQDQGGALRIEIEAATAGNRKVLLEAVLLPLIHTPNVVDRFLGSIAPMTQPMWLGTEPLVCLKLEAAEIVWPDGRPHAIAERMNQIPVLGPQATAGRLVRFDRRQFRVLDGGRATDDKAR